MTAPPVVLEVSSLDIYIGQTKAVDNVNLRIHSGEALALVGESGCGKSLTSLGIMGLLPQVARMGEQTRVCVNGTNITGYDESAYNTLRGKDMGMIFQEPLTSLNPLMPVGLQVMESLLVHGVSEAQAREWALSMLQRVGIPDPDARFRQYPFELSGGMCQRIMIALALVGNPLLLIADEPTTALDVTIQAQILDLMRDLMQEVSTALLIITHDLGVVTELADQVAVMYGGSIVETAPARELFARQLHPYTRLLLSSIPRLDTAPKTLLNTISGTVPDIHTHVEGCRFNPRCPQATNRCRCEKPLLLDTDFPERRVACWNADIGDTKERAHEPS